MSANPLIPEPPTVAAATGRSCTRRAPVRWWLALLAWSVLAGTAACAGDETVAKEYQIKAAFLYNFTKFVEWPPRHFADDHQPIVIVVLGRNPFGGELEAVVRGRQVNGRDLVVKTLASATAGTTADLVFVAAGEEWRLEGVVEVLRAGGMLTVGESARFKELGGVITLTLEGDKIRFEIDATAAERGGLKLSAQLLKLAAVVHRKS